jgi:2-iminoacetate synthase ThiH
VRDLQRETGGFTEFVPLPFVHMEAPIYLKGRARPGPTCDKEEPEAECESDEALRVIREA